MIYQRNRYKNWFFTLKQWDTGKRKWVRRPTNTGIPLTDSKSAAEDVARGLQKAAYEMAPDHHGRKDKQWYDRLLQDICNRAGVESFSEEVTWADWVEKWKESKVKELRDPRPFERTMRYWLEWLGSKAKQPLSSTTPTMAVDYFKHLEKRMAPGTLKIHKVYLSECMGRARDLGYTNSNPFKLVKINTKAQAKMERAPFTMPEMQRIVEHVRGKEWELAVMFGACFGLRIGDAVSRKKSEIVTGMDGSQWFEFEPAKTKGKGKIRLPVMPQMETLIARSKTDLLTPGLKSKVNNLFREWNEIMEKCEVEIEETQLATKIWRNKGFHSLRYFSKSQLIGTGTDSRMADLINNHTDSRVAEGYTKVEIPKLQEAIERAVGNLW